MSAAEKRMRAHFAQYKGERSGDFIRSMTTSEGVFPLLVADIKYVMGERRRTAREIERAVRAIDPVEWALAGQDAASIVAEICKRIGAK